MSSVLRGTWCCRTTHPADLTPHIPSPPCLVWDEMGPVWCQVLWGLGAAGPPHPAVPLPHTPLPAALHVARTVLMSPQQPRCPSLPADLAVAAAACGGASTADLAAAAVAAAAAGGDRPYLISGADDKLVKIWDYQTKACVQTLDGHAHNIAAVSSVCVRSGGGGKVGRWVCL